MAKILIIDDSRTSRRLLRGLLEEAGHEVIGEAVNGLDGIEKYKELKPDLATMDITMPVMDGIAALEQIRMEDPSSKIIMMSASGQKSKIMEAIKLGASDFVQKPFEKELIIGAIERIVG